MEFQTRTQDGELKQFNTLKEAMTYARENKEVWKVSFNLPTGDNVRLVKVNEYGEFMYTSMNDIL